MSTVEKSEIVNILSELTRIETETLFKAQSLEELGLQSLEKVELMCALEDHFQIDLDFQDFENIRFVDDVVALVQKKVSDRHA
jgi:acyl carrier protein